MKSIRACELFEQLCVMALAVRGEIAVTGDMVPTIVFGFSIIDQWDGFPICTRAELVELHQCVTVRTIINDCQISSCGMPSSVLADAILGSISANVYFSGRAVLETRISASSAAGTTYFLETNTRID